MKFNLASLFVDPDSHISRHQVWLLRLAFAVWASLTTGLVQFLGVLANVSGHPAWAASMCCLSLATVASWAALLLSGQRHLLPKAALAATLTYLGLRLASEHVLVAWGVIWLILPPALLVLFWCVPFTRNPAPWSILSLLGCFLYAPLIPAALLKTPSYGYEVIQFPSWAFVILVGLPVILPTSVIGIIVLAETRAKQASPPANLDPHASYPFGSAAWTAGWAVLLLIFGGTLFWGALCFDWTPFGRTVSWRSPWAVPYGWEQELIWGAYGFQAGHLLLLAFAVALGVLRGTRPLAAVCMILAALDAGLAYPFNEYLGGRGLVPRSTGDWFRVPCWSMIHGFSAAAMLFLLSDANWFKPRRPTAGGRHLVLFDGACGLCTRVVRFLLEEDFHQVLSFAPLAGPTAQPVLERAEHAGPGRDTLVYVRNQGTPAEECYTRSDAVLRILRDTGGFFATGIVLLTLPCWLRDAVYGLVARSRGRLSRACHWLPLPSDPPDRFLP